MDSDSGVEVLERVTDDAELLVVDEVVFSSLYRSESGTYAAIAVGIFMVTMVQLGIVRIFERTRSMIEALTFFATSMVGFLVAVFLCDLLIAGADVMLLQEGERADIVSFIRDTCLMVFAYFFGTKSAATGSVTNDVD